jgi:RHS repeat-associated protein
LAGIVGRRMRRVVAVIAAFVAAAVWATPAPAQAGCTVSWVGPATGTWSTATAWSTGTVPTIGDSVCLPSGTTVTVSSSAAAADVQGAGASLVVNSALALQDGAGVSRIGALTHSGTVSVAGELRIVGSLTMSGTLGGAGTVVVESGATGVVNDATLDALTLRNDGSLAQGDTRRLWGRNGAVLDNRGTYTLNTARCLGCAYAPGILWSPNADAQPRFLNSGVLRKTAGGSGTEIGFGFDNDGTVSISSGDVAFTRGSGTSGGSWSGTVGGRPVLDGAFTLAAGVQASGALGVGSQGVVSVGDLDGGAALSVRGVLELSDAQGTARFASLDHTGTVRGPGQLRIGQSVILNGTLSGTGSTVIEAGATGTVGDATLNEATLRNDGSLTQTGTSRVWGRNGAVLDNRGTYTLNTARCTGCSYAPGILWSPSGDAQPNVLNTGLIRKTAAGSGTEVSFGLDNDGAVSIDSGDVYLKRGTGTSSGSWAGTTSGRPILDGPFALGLAVELTGAMTVGWSGGVTAGHLDGPGAALKVDGSLELTDPGVPSRIGSLTHTGFVRGAGELRIAESVAWTGGRLAGIGLVIIEAGATGTIGDATIDGFTLRNEGSLTQTGTSRVWGKNGGVIDNRGTYTLNTARCTGCSYAPGLLWSPSGDAQPRLLNTGLIRKTAAGSGTEVSFGFDNDGAVSIDAGDVNFKRGTGTSTGSWTGTSAGRPILDGPFTLGSGIGVTGALTVGGPGVVSAGDLQGSGAGVLVQGTLELRDAAVSRVGGLNMTGTTRTAGELRVGNALSMSSSATLAGTGSVVLESGATGAIVDGTLDRVTFRNDGSILQSGTARLWGKNGAVLDNRGTYVLNTARCTGCSYAPGILWSPNGDQQPTLLNTGAIEKTTGSSGTEVSFGLDNDGAVSIASGDVRFTRGAAGSTSTGSWSGTTTGRAVLDGPFTLGSVGVSGALTIGSQGAVSVDALTGGDAAVTVQGTLTLDDPAAASSVASLTQTGTIAGGGRVRVNSALTMSGSATLRGSGSMLVAADATGQIIDGTLDGFTLRNDGTLSQSDTSRLWGKNGAVLDNRGTYTLNAQRCSGCGYDVGLMDQRVGDTPVFVNTGVLQKTQGTGTGVVEWGLDNRGTVKELTGKLDLRGPMVRLAPRPDESYGPGNVATPNVRRSCSGKPVDCATGNQFEVQNDLAVGGRGLGLELVRTYNSQAAAAQAAPGPMGYGWTFSYTDRLVVEPAQRRATVLQSDGSAVPFLINADGTFGAPSWVHAKLTKEADGSYAYLLPDQRRLTFDAGGALRKLADRNGNDTTLAYDGAGRLDSVTDPAGRSLDLGYDGDGMLASVTDPTGLTVRYGYVGGNLERVTYEGEPEPQWRFGYDGAHQLTSMTDGRGETTRTEYDEQRRAISQTDALDRTRTWTYLDGETRIRNPGGDVTVQRFDVNGQPISTISAFGTPAETTRTMAYDANRNLTRVTDGNGHTTTFGYDAAGNRMSATDPNGHTTRWTYDAKRNITSTTTPSGRVTTLAYDGRGNLTRQSRTLVRPGQPDASQTLAIDYDEHGQPIRVTDPLQRTWTYTYNARGDRTSETTPLGETTTWTYDAASRLTSTVSPRGNAPGADPAAFMTVITRDRFGRPTDVRDPLGHHTTTIYDANDNVTAVRDGEGRRTEVAYDAENQPTRVQRGSERQTTVYDANGRVASLTNGRDKTTTYHRDAAGRVTRVVDPLGRETTHAVDAASLITGVTDPLGRTTTYDYDAADRLTGIDYSSADTPDVTFAYDADGRRTRMTDGTGTSTYEYDTLDRLTSVTNGAGRTVDYAYDLADQRTGLTYPNGETVTSAYDDAGRLRSVTDWLGHTTEIDYDADSNQTATRFPVGADTYGHDAAGRIAETALGGAASIALTRNAAGQLTGADWQGLPGASQAYGYGPSGRLTSAGGAAYAYDEAGNPTALGSTTDLTYDDADQLVQTTTPGGQVDFDYDAAGNRSAVTPASGPATAYEHDQAGRLRAFERDGEPSIAYAYDGDGLRASRTKDGTTTRFTWDASDDGLPLLLTRGDTSYVYDADGLPLERIDGDGNAVFFHHDQHGSTRMLTDEDGDVLGTYSYDAYGALSGSTGPPPELGFAGEYTEADTGLVYLRARDYDPATGQFLTRDPLEDVSGEPYTYADGDPVNRIDPLGLLGFDDLKDGFNATFGPEGFVDDVVPDVVSNAAAGYLDGWTEGALSDAFGIETWCDAPGYGFGDAASNASWRGLVKGGLKAGAKAFAKKSRGGPGKAPTGPKRPARHRRKEGDRKGDRGPYRKRPPGWKGPWPPKQSR